MAWYRQASQPWQVGGGLDSSVNGDQRASLRVHDHAGGKTGHSGWARTRSWKSKRFSRPASRHRQFSIGVFVVLLLLAVLVTFFGSDYIFALIRVLRGEELHFGLPGLYDAGHLAIHDRKDQSVSVINMDDGLSGGNTQMSSDDDRGSDKHERGTGKSRRGRKHTSAACGIAFRNSTSGLRVPTDTSTFQSFSLNYIQKEEKPEGDLPWTPKFAGHQSLLQREESFRAGDQTMHCGFVEGPEEYPKTGFELGKDDVDYLQTCHIAVSSCIFGNYDHLRNPPVKKVSSSAKEKVCFAMFVDQQSLDGMIDEGEVPDGNMTHGLWRIVLIKNLPFSDNRRTGKVPKFLTHRLFPNAKYSIWLDSKLRLQSDPLLILEHFLWRGKHEYAISNHYDRHCVWEEVAQNKKLNKFSHKVIDEQFEFYQRDGLTRFNASDPRKLLPSNVPEGSFIVRAHTPMSNLFSCLWFNEVDRFTSRDQLSFAYTYLKFVRKNPSSRFRFHMFKDCERREMTKLFHHKQEEGVKH